MNFSKITNFMDSLSGFGIPGADLAVFLKGKEVYRYRVGFADLEKKTKITNDTLYAIWSMTKVVTCVAALRLFEEGRYLLNDPLYEYMPEFKDMTIRHARGNGEFEEKPAKNPIRIKDLFTMSSGFSYDVFDKNEYVLRAGGNIKLQDLVKIFAAEKLNFEPGTRWRYGVSHDILGALIEVLSGKRLGQYFEDYIFAPLDMKDTGFKVPKSKHHRIATCYTYDEINKTHANINIFIIHKYINKPNTLQENSSF